MTPLSNRLTDLQLAHISRIAYEAERAYWKSLGKDIGASWDEEENYVRAIWIKYVAHCADSNFETVSEYHARSLDSITDERLAGPYFIVYAIEESDSLIAVKTSFEDLSPAIVTSIFMFYSTVKTYVTIEEPYSIHELYECHGLDTQERVCFYEQDHYYLSNFSSFQIEAYDLKFPTSEHLYHWTRFHLAETDPAQQMCQLILEAPSAHEAFKLAQANKSKQVDDWDNIKFVEMKKILILKVKQHEYVYRKLLQTGDRVLVENSHRDSIWGWGEDKTGQNMLGKLWMAVRSELQTRTGDFV